MKLSDFDEVQQLIGDREAIGQYLDDYENGMREGGEDLHLRLHAMWHTISGELADALIADIAAKRRAHAEQIDARLKELGVEINMPLIPEDEDEGDLELAEDDAE